MSDSPLRIKTISQFHTLRGLPKPKHPLISVINFEDMAPALESGKQRLMFDFYMISVKRDMDHKYRYGQQDYDFDEGVMFCMAPHQILSVIREENGKNPSGWMMMIHPDFLWNTPLASAIKKYEFFDYSVNEALFLSEDEEIKIQQITDNIKQEYQTNIDKFSQRIIISQLETLLNYSQRFYQRQFITRHKVHHQFLERLEILLKDYFEGNNLKEQGLPSVQLLSDKFNMSQYYMRSLLKTLTGQTTQQHIHEKLIEKAKEKLSTTELSVSEIAYELGFEHSQSFSKLFKAKTDISPMEFRKLLN
ncbi:helix-turn-helix transcriptional regulator [Pedobacter sp. ISL-68]|uniref:helix-turn-helix domain-containing protein n=1 Tax=unclassified Pedobacter TaxID=2628915 RepID=UPI001BEB6556|nr:MULTISPECIES: helix-turn-helix transcriptional regulator [unclassified Pedobacter]MBT2560910.1 helix-turn-helix transcriptional regulator [Pedobacter sp. ISL-64]MBT2590300.1 helix-turn-helix transcriptional regulator [Pedobacter sp. ISL-68]